MDLARIRETTDDKLAGVLRLALAVLFVMAGAAKILVPKLGEAFSGQLLAAGLPFYELSRSSVPIVEVLAGVVLGLGLYTRLATIVVVVIMAVATYVHLVIDDPSLFPLQSTAPTVPLVVIAICLYLLWKGGGAWSRDLAATRGR